MGDAITVHVLGPRLIAQSLCALLNDFPDIRAELAAPRVTPKDGVAATRSEVLLMVMPRLGGDGYTEASGALVARRGLDSGPAARLVVPEGYPPFRVALVTSGVESDLAAGCAARLRIFLSVEDEARVLRQGLVAAAKGEPFCSPSLATHIVCTLYEKSNALTKQIGLVALLSDRERQVAELVACGLSNSGIAADLFVSVSTVKAHLGQVFDKLQIVRRSQVAQALLTFPLEHSAIRPVETYSCDR